MSNQKLQLPLRILLGAIAGFLPFLSVRAESPKVTAVLSNSQVAVGQAVRLDIRVVGASDARPPQNIAADGLDIHYTGQAQESHITFGTGGMQSSTDVTFTYTILPLKSGTFKIPPQTIQVGGNSFQTPELQLNVVGSNAGTAGQGRGNPNGSTAHTSGAKVAFAELIVTKKSAYVGEMVPVEVRLGFYSQTARPADGPEITGRGFTMQKLQQSEQPRLENINGKPYEVLTFKTAIAAARPGKFEIGPVQAGAIVAVPRRQSSSRGRSPFDIFNMDDPFADPFGVFGQQQQKITIKSEPATLEVKPLPPNAPSDFSGAIGNFTMNVEASPKSVQTGDPITVTATVAGRGNFDRVTAPTLQDDGGWHKYPPSSKFKQDDDVGISGSKTFETVLSPNEKKQAIPVFGFSFFDPLTEKYVSLRSDAIPIKVEGGSVAAASAPAPAKNTAAPTATATAAPQASATPSDILYQLNDRLKAAESFTPLYLRGTFWLAQLIPLLALLGFGSWKIRQARLQNKEALRTATLQQEAAELMRKLRRDQSAPREYYADASRAVQVKTALAANSDPNGVDAEVAARTFRLDEKAQTRLRQLFERSDEARYSGSSNGFDGIPTEERREILDLIDHLQA